jgi:hypothetical protein
MAFQSICLAVFFQADALAVEVTIVRLSRLEAVWGLAFIAGEV